MEDLSGEIVVRAPSKADLGSGDAFNINIPRQRQSSTFWIKDRSTNLNSQATAHTNINSSKFLPSRRTCKYHLLMLTNVAAHLDFSSPLWASVASI